MSFVLAIDQGTTSSRAIVFRSDISIAATAQQEFPQHFPASGWVEHEPEDIWTSTVMVCRDALEKAGLKAKDIAAIGITNQRETTVVWDRATGQAIHRAIVWQDRRTADICARLKAEGHEPAISAKTGLIIDPYFSGTKVAWILDHVPGARERAGRGELLFGTVDCYLLWRLTGGKVHATDATNASRTLLFNIHTGEWDDELLKILRVPRSMLPEVKDSSHQFRRQRRRPVRRRDRDLRHRRRPAGRHHRAGLLHARHDQIDLRHRLLRAAQHRHHAGGLEEQAAHHHRLSAERQTHLRARRLDLRRGLGGAMAARRARHHQAGRRDRPARRQIRFHARASIWCRPLSASARPTGIRACAARCSGSPATPAPPNWRMPRWKASATRPSISGPRCAPTGPSEKAANIVLRVDGGMTASDWTMQRLADLLDAPVDRPMIQETTALGAAYLAGLQAGVYPEPAKFADNWRLEHRFKPAMSKATRERKLAGWARAVKGVLASDEGEGVILPDGTSTFPPARSPPSSRIWR